MSITFRCEHCHKQVEAPDSAAGKRGKCPHCGLSSYIPSPVSEDDVLPLAPLDAEEERRVKAEKEKLLRQERALYSETAKEQEPSVPLEDRPDISSGDVQHLVVNYCLDMAGGNLGRAETYAGELARFGAPAVQAVDDFISGKAIEPALDSVPTRVLQGFLKELRAKLG